MPAERGSKEKSNQDADAVFPSTISKSPGACVTFHLSASGVKTSKASLKTVKVLTGLTLWWLAPS